MQSVRDTIVPIQTTCGPRVYIIQDIATEGFFKVACLWRFELQTFASGGRHSIQLSYRHA